MFQQDAKRKDIVDLHDLLPRMEFLNRQIVLVCLPDGVESDNLR